MGLSGIVEWDSLTRSGDDEHGRVAARASRPDNHKFIGHGCAAAL